MQGNPRLLCRKGLWYEPHPHSSKASGDRAAVDANKFVWKKSQSSAWGGNILKERGEHTEEVLLAANGGRSAGNGYPSTTILMKGKIKKTDQLAPEPTPIAVMGLHWAPTWAVMGPRMAPTRPARTSLASMDPAWCTDPQHWTGPLLQLP